MSVRLGAAAANKHRYKKRQCEGVVGLRFGMSRYRRDNDGTSTYRVIHDVSQKSIGQPRLPMRMRRKSNQFVWLDFFQSFGHGSFVNVSGQESGSGVPRNGNNNFMNILRCRSGSVHNV